MQAIFFAALMVVAPDGVDPAAAPQLSAENKVLLAKCVQFTREDSQSACTDLIAQTDLDPRGRVVALLARSHIRLTKNDASGAMDDANAAIAADPTVAQPYVVRANLYRIQQKFDLALADANKAVSAGPDQGTAYLMRGDIELQTSQSAQGLADGNRAMELLPNVAESWMTRGLAEYQLHQWDPAIADLSHAITLKPQIPFVAYQIRGLAYRNEGKYEEALADTTQEIALAPKNYLAYIDRANAYMMRNLSDLAITDYTQALTLNPAAPDAFRLRAIAETRKADFTAAQADADDYIKRTPGLPNGFALRGDIDLTQRRYDDAVADFTKAIGIKEMAEYYNGRGVAYEQLNRDQDAMADADKSLMVDPKWGSGMMLRAALHEKAHDNEAAIADYRAALKLNIAPAAAAIAQKALTRLGAAP